MEEKQEGDDELWPCLKKPSFRRIRTACPALRFDFFFTLLFFNPQHQGDLQNILDLWESPRNFTAPFGAVCVCPCVLPCPFAESFLICHFRRFKIIAPNEGLASDLVVIHLSGCQTPALTDPGLQRREGGTPWLSPAGISGRLILDNWICDFFVPLSG